MRRGKTPASASKARCGSAAPRRRSGYFRNEEASSALFPEGRAAGWLNSGDRAYRADGEIFITGRVKDIILKAGRNLYPHEIEEIAGARSGSAQRLRRGVWSAPIPRPAPSVWWSWRKHVSATPRRGSASPRPSRKVSRRPSVCRRTPSSCCRRTASPKLRAASCGAIRRGELYLAGTLGAAAPPAWLQVARLATASGARAVRAGRAGILEFALRHLRQRCLRAVVVPTWLAGQLGAEPPRGGAYHVGRTARVSGACGLPVRVVGREHLAHARGRACS